MSMQSAHFPKIIGTATINDKGQLVIPVEARNKFGLEPGSRVVLMSSSEKPVLSLVKAEVLEEMVKNLTDALDISKKTK